MTIDEKIEVLEACKARKPLQIRWKSSRRWEDCDYANGDLCFNFADWEYRVKPEEVKPKFREIPVEKLGLYLWAGGECLDAWPGRSDFVGYKFADGSVLSCALVYRKPGGVHYLDTNIAHLNDGLREAERPTHVVVMEE